MHRLIDSFIQKKQFLRRIGGCERQATGGDHDATGGENDAAAEQDDDATGEQDDNISCQPGDGVVRNGNQHGVVNVRIVSMAQ